MNTSKLKEIQDALDIDPVAEAEMFGLQNDLGVLLFLSGGKKKRVDALLAETNDVNSYSQTLAEYLTTVESMGFVKVYDQPIPETEDRELMYWNADKGMLLHMDTYGGNVNGGNVYFNLDGGYVSGCSGGSYWPNGYDENVPGIFIGDKDCREALRHFIETGESKGKFLKKWVRQPWMWLLHYMDTKVEGYDHKAITASKIAMLPADVQKAIDAPQD